MPPDVIMLVRFDGLLSGMVRIRIHIPTRRKSNLKNRIIMILAKYLLMFFRYFGKT